MRKSTAHSKRQKQREDKQAELPLAARVRRCTTARAQVRRYNVVAKSRSGILQHVGTGMLAIVFTVLSLSQGSEEVPSLDSSWTAAPCRTQTT